MSDDEGILLMGVNDNIQDDMIQTFQLEQSNLRGRIVRMGTVLDDILVPHKYPNAVAQLVSEATGLSLLLGGMLKFEGTFTLQAQGNGPVRMVVSDLTTKGEVRGVASYDREKLAAAGIADSTVVGFHAADKVYDLKTLMGEGYLAFTVDQGDHMERYQGIVELKGEELATCVMHYFDQSEQIDTVIKIAAGLVNGTWRVGGIMIQRLPIPDVEQTTERLASAQDDWDRAQALLGTCTRDELIRETLLPNDLLFRLFHEEGVRVYNPLHLTKGCRCNMDKLRVVLGAMPKDDIDHMTVDGKITMTCEFCNKDFDFSPDEIKGEPT